MFYVYILKSRRDGKIYIGFTSDLSNRLEEHNSGKTKSTSYRTPLDLVYYEAYKSRDDAEKREKMLIFTQFKEIIDVLDRPRKGKAKQRSGG